MSAALVDVNVLVALLDPAHVHFDAAHEWLSSLRGDPWATCPIVINGCIRVLARPGYADRPLAPSEASSMLRALCQKPNHEFWPEEVSLLDESRFDLSRVSGPRQITDVYLLALAVVRNGRLATFDRTIPWQAVRGGARRHLQILGGL